MYKAVLITEYDEYSFVPLYDIPSLKRKGRVYNSYVIQCYYPYTKICGLVYHILNSFQRYLGM